MPQCLWCPLGGARSLNPLHFLKEFGLGLICLTLTMKEGWFMLKKVFFTCAFGAILSTNMGFTACPEVSKNIGDLRKQHMIEMNGTLVTVNTTSDLENLPKLTGKFTGGSFFKLVTEDSNKRTCEYEYKSAGIGKRYTFTLRMVHDENSDIKSLADEMEAIQKASKEFDISLYPFPSACEKINEAYGKKVEALGSFDQGQSKEAYENNLSIREKILPLKKQREHLFVYFNCPSSN